MQPQPDNYYSSIPGTSSVAGAQSSVVAITDSPTPIRLAAKFTQDAIEYGHTDEMTGTVEYYQSAKTLKPLPNTTVTIARLSPPGAAEDHREDQRGRRVPGPHPPADRHRDLGRHRRRDRACSARRW